MKTIIETHGDFFRDLELWLPDFFFTKLVRASLEVRAHMLYIVVYSAVHYVPSYMYCEGSAVLM
jgi:hypothetical protein